MNDAEMLAMEIKKLRDGLLLVVTGAGVSLASGIPTFRGTDKDAVWKRDVMELGTLRYFREDPAGSWRWYMQRFDGVFGVEPNPAHHALVALERWKRERGEFLLVTQNIDTLHEQAGSEALVKVHGSADRVRCATEGCPNGAPSGSLPRAEIEMAAFRAEPTLEHVPRCGRCNDVLRQHVLWFDEHYQGHDDYQWESVVRGATTSGLVLFIGTSLSVGVTDMLVRAAAFRGVPLYSIDPGPGPGSYTPVEHIQAKAEELLPEVNRLLGASG